MWSHWGGKQIDLRMPKWAAGRETSDEGMCGPLHQSGHNWCDRDWTVVSVFLRCCSTLGIVVGLSFFPLPRYCGCSKRHAEQISDRLAEYERSHAEETISYSLTYSSGVSVSVTNCFRVRATWSGSVKMVVNSLNVFHQTYRFE